MKNRKVGNSHETPDNSFKDFFFPFDEDFHKAMGHKQTYGHLFNADQVDTAFVKFVKTDESGIHLQFSA